MFHGYVLPKHIFTQAQMIRRINEASMLDISRIEEKPKRPPMAPEVCDGDDGDDTSDSWTITMMYIMYLHNILLCIYNYIYIMLLYVS